MGPDGSDAALGLRDLSVAVEAARRTHMMRQLDFTTVGAFVDGRRDQRMVRTTIVPPGTGNFLLWDRHDLRLYFRIGGFLGLYQAFPGRTSALIRLA